MTLSVSSTMIMATTILIVTTLICIYMILTPTIRFVVSNMVVAKDAKRYLDQKLCYKLVGLFDSEDPRERDYLKVNCCCCQNYFTLII